MTTKAPTGELDARYSMEGVGPTSWSDVTDSLERAELYWFSTVRPDGRLHATPLIGLWLDGAWCFCTGPDEQKAKNLAANPHCMVVTGCNTLHEGLDLVIEGDAVRVADDAKLQRIADGYVAKYGDEWHFDVRDWEFHHEAGSALVFEVVPAAAYAFGKGDYSHTRWRFE